MSDQDTTPDPWADCMRYGPHTRPSGQWYPARHVDAALAAERAAHAAEVEKLRASLMAFRQAVEANTDLARIEGLREGFVAGNGTKRDADGWRFDMPWSSVEEQWSAFLAQRAKTQATSPSLHAAEVSAKDAEIARLKSQALDISERLRFAGAPAMPLPEAVGWLARQADETSNGCTSYLKDGETPAECIKRNRDDVDAALFMLAKEQRTVAAQTEEIARLKAEVGRLKGEPDCLGVLDALTMQTQAVDVYAGWLGEVRRVAQAWFGDDAQRVDGAGFAKWLDQQIEPRINAAYARGESAGLLEGFRARAQARLTPTGWTFDGELFDNEELKLAAFLASHPKEPYEPPLTLNQQEIAHSKDRALRSKHEAVGYARGVSAGLEQLSRLRKLPHELTLGEALAYLDVAAHEKEQS